LISVHLLDTLLTVGGNLTHDHRYRSINASSNGDSNGSSQPLTAATADSA
jgi:hypothetical protein